ncbi:MAG: bifunctional DNA-formamidopyrimidine glycosylase/DNA-(apurinic or apyrimidinic site) lyase [Terriglobia bacterium]
MPELPEVETIRRGLNRRAVGREIRQVEVLNFWVIRGNQQVFIQQLEGRRISRVDRKGKLLAFELSKGGEPTAHLVVRLGMTGQLTLSPRREPLLPHTHVRITLEEGREELRYRDPRRFGTLRCCTAAELGEIVRRLGPDALKITLKQFRASLRGRQGAIKGWLLNQRMVAGLGNIYADEALFDSRIHPQSPAGALPSRASRALHSAAVNVLQRAITFQGTSFRDYIDIYGNPGNFGARLSVYGRTDQPCPRCGNPICRIIVCGRSSHFCPHCQPCLKRSSSSPTQAAGKRPPSSGGVRRVGAS